MSKLGPMHIFMYADDTCKRLLHTCTASLNVLSKHEVRGVTTCRRSSLAIQLSHLQALLHSYAGRCADPL